MGRGKREVAGYAGLLGLRGYVVGADGNVSRRRGPEAMLITPTGVAYDLLSAGQICRIGLDGAGTSRCRPSSEWRLHAAVYRARPDVAAVIHAHPVHACVLAANREPLPPLLDEVTALLGGRVEVAGYTPSGSAALGEAAVRAMAERNAALLANHGCVCVGASLAEAFYRLEVLERAAHVFLMARLTGTPALLE